MKIILPAVLVAVLVAVSSSGATISASSPSWVDVSNAVASASTGDTVSVPGGAANWTNVLLLTKAVRLIGAGTNSTTISNSIAWSGAYSSGWRPPLINVQLPTNGDVRISGFRFACRTNQGIFFYQTAASGSPAVYSHRVDNCLFEMPYSYGIWYSGIIDGVVDHCTFVDPRLGIGRNGMDSTDWNRFTPPLLGLGSTNTLVVETCSFVWTASAPSSQPIDCGQGSHYVFRYNTLDWSNANTSASHDGLDLHGNNHMESVDGWRGSVFSEIYGNTFTWGPDNGFRLARLRGGTSMVFSNVITGSVSRKPWEVLMDEEEVWANYVYDYPENILVRTNPPSQDQITNSFVWENDVNGSVSNSIARLLSANPDLNPVTAGTTNNPVALTVLEGTDYWQKSPWSGNYTNRSGSVNAMTGYVPLVYPHPRVTADGASLFRATTARVGTIRSP